MAAECESGGVRVVVIGSYPPLPGPATAATLAAVKEGMGRGRRRTRRVVPHGGGRNSRAGGRPARGPACRPRPPAVRQPSEVVLGLQRGVPFSDPRPSQQMATAVGLAAALRRFRRATLLVGEDPEVMPACFRILASAVERFVVATPEDASWLVKRYRLKPAIVVVEAVEPYPRVPDGVDLTTAGLYAAWRRHRPHCGAVAHNDPGGQGPRQNAAGMGARFTLVSKVGRLAKLRFDGPAWLA